MTKNIWLASFDIGKKNFSFYIEEFNKDELMTIINIEKNKRYNKNSSCTEDFQYLLSKIYKNGKKILLKNVDLTKNCDQKLYLDTETFHNLTDILDEHVEYWDKCQAFVIEKQMSFGKRHNTMALKLGQHCWSYFSFKYGRFKEIIEFPAYHKTQILGAEKIEYKHKGKIKYKSINKPKRKKWCVNKCLDILSLRKDEESIEQIKKEKKKDDLCDVICQLQAFKYLVYVDKSLFI